MKNKITVLYDNTYYCTNYKDTQAYLFENYAEEHGWETADDVPEKMIYDEMDEQDRAEWQDFLDELHFMLSENKYLLTGACGKWYGPCECGKFIDSTDDLLYCIQHLDSVRFYDESGHLKICGFHHDGEDTYELKRLTDKGAALAEKYGYACDRALHRSIMQSNFYSALPHLAKRIGAV